MIRNATETENSDLRVVERWLYQHGDVPSDVAIVNAVAACMLEWARQRNSGMDILAQVSLEKAEDIVTTAKGLI